MTVPEKPERTESSAGFKVMLFFLALLLTITVPLSLLMFNISRVVFNQDLVKEATADAIVDSELVVAGLTWFAEWRAQLRYEEEIAQPWVGEPDVIQLMMFMDRDDWTIIRGEVLTDEFLVEWSDVTIDSVYEWIDSADRLPQIALPMGSFQDRVNSEHGEESVRVAYRALPSPCSQAQMDAFEDAIETLEEGQEALYPLCQMSEPWRTDQINDYVDGLEKAVNAIPEEFYITERLSEDRIFLLENVPPDRVKNILRSIRILMRWSVALPLLIAILMLMTGADQQVHRGLWVGIPIIFGGLIALILGLIHRSLITSFVVNIPLETVPQAAVDEGLAFLLVLASSTFGLMITMSAVVLVVGVVVIIIGYFFGGGGPVDDDELEEDLVTRPVSGSSSQNT